MAQGPTVGALVKLGMNDDHRTKVGRRIRTAREWSSQPRPAKIDFLYNLHVKIHVSHGGVHAMDRLDVGRIDNCRRIG